MINKYNKFFERVDDDSWEGDWDDIQSEFQEIQEYDDYDDDENDDMNHLKYLLRSMFKNKGFESISITNKKLNLNIRCMLAYREKLSDLVSLFDIINKLKSDILPQYECEFDMWYNKQGQTLEFEFLYDDDDDDDFENPF